MKEMVISKLSRVRNIERIIPAITIIVLNKGSPDGPSPLLPGACGCPSNLGRIRRYNLYPLSTRKEKVTQIDRTGISRRSDIIAEQLG